MPRATGLPEERKTPYTEKPGILQVETGFIETSNPGYIAGEAAVLTLDYK